MVSLPAGDQSSATDVWVRCPLCQSEFTLQEALNFVPPALEIIASPRSEEEAHVALADAEAGLGDPDEGAVGIGLSGTRRLPMSKLARPKSDQSIPDLLINPERETVVAPQQTFSADVTFAPTVASQITADENTPGDDLQLSPEMPAARPTPMPTRAVPMSNVAASGAAANEPWNAPPEGNAPMFFPPLPPKRTRGFRRAKRRNPVVELALIVVGGIAGCAIAFGVLLWGFKVDPFDLAKYLPQSMVPEPLRSASSADATNPPSSSDTVRGNGIVITRNRPASVSGPTATESNMSNGTPGSAITSSTPVPGPGSSVPSPSSVTGPVSNNETSPFTPVTPEAQTHPALPPLPQPTTPAPTEPDGPKSDSIYSLDDVSKAFTAATQADAAFQSARANNGNAKDSPAVAELRKQNYIALAKLAETVTLLRNQNDDRQIARSTAAAFVLHAVDDRAKLEDLGTLAGHWLSIPNRASRGIVLAGAVQSVDPLGKQFCTTIKVLGHDLDVSVISAEKPEISPHDMAVVLGVIVPNPQQNLPQYAGKDDQVVWGAVVEKPMPAANP
jgi:hypothetical protein